MFCELYPYSVGDDKDYNDFVNLKPLLRGHKNEDLIIQSNGCKQIGYENTYIFITKNDNLGSLTAQQIESVFNVTIPERTLCAFVVRSS